MSNETNQGAVIEIHSITDDMGKVRRGSCSLFLVISKKWQNQMKLRDYMFKVIMRRHFLPYTASI